MDTLTLKKSLYIVFFILVVVGFSAFIGFSACNKDLTTDSGGGEPSAPEVNPDENYSWKEHTAAAEWSPRKAHQVVLKGEEFYFMGGQGNGKWNDVWKSSDGTTWTPVIANAAWEGRYNHQVVVKNGEFYLFGGQSNVGLHNDVWKSSDGETWTEISADDPTTTSKWLPRGMHRVLLKGDEFYLIGGFTPQTSPGIRNDVWKSSDGINWTEVSAHDAGATNKWESRYNYDVVLKDGAFYVFGGYGFVGGTPLNDVWKSNDGVSWTQISPQDANTTSKWTIRQHHNVVVKGGYFYLLGGETNNVNRNDAWRSSDGITWKQASENDPATPMWSARREFAALVKGDAIYVFGGNDGADKQDVWIFSED